MNLSYRRTSDDREDVADSTRAGVDPPFTTVSEWRFISLGRLPGRTVPPTLKCGYLVAFLIEGTDRSRSGESSRVRNCKKFSARFPLDDEMTSTFHRYTPEGARCEQSSTLLYRATTLPAEEAYLLSKRKRI